MDSRTGLETWRRENFFSYRDSNSKLSVVQPVVGRYTDCVILAPNLKEHKKKNTSRKTNHLLCSHYVLSISYDADLAENAASRSSAIVPCTFVEVRTFLPSRCLAKFLSSSSNIATLLGGGGKQRAR
jgi:hypothetical protein